MKKINWIFVVILVLAAFLRFFRLGENPPSLTWDEVSWGYNAYAIGTDGKDEFGRFLPFDYLESFGDFKPPVYAYLTVLPVKVFGLNEFATRFSSALFGTLTVLLTYFLVLELFRKPYIALVSSLFLAISPWHINLSRAAFEANVATFFLVCGVLLFLKGIRKNGLMFLLFPVPFVLSLYTFNTSRVVAPLLVGVLMIGFRKELFQRGKQAILAILIGCLLIVPIAKFLVSPQASLRFREVNIFSDITIIETTNQEMINDGNAIWSKILHNRRLVYGVEFAKHYLDNLSPQFLFIKGDGNPKFSTQDVGQLYLWELPFFIAGIFLLFKKREGKWWLVPVWLLIGIIPAASARETPHALRIETTIPMFQIFSAYGVFYAFSRLKNRYMTASIFLLLFLNVLYYLNGYYMHYPSEFSGEWQYGYKDAISYTKAVEDNYDQILVTNGLGRPYVYYLFYTKTDPKIFRQNSVIKRDAFGFVTVEKIGKYTFGKDLIPIKKVKRTLFINTPQRLPSKANILKTFRLLNGDPWLVAYVLS